MRSLPDPGDSWLYRQNSLPIRLVVLLVAIWLGMGLIGHAPWKPDEGTTMVAIRNLLEGAFWGAPQVHGRLLTEHGPLYYVVASLPTWLLSGWLPAEDAARLTSGFFMAATLAFTGLAAREAWGRGVGRIAILLLIGCLGILVRSHQLTPHLALLSGLSLGLFGVVRSLRRPLQGGLLLGSSAWICLAAQGIVFALLPVLLTVLLPAASTFWRQRSLLQSAVVALPLLGALLLIWPGSLYTHDPQLFNAWSAAQERLLRAFSTVTWQQVLMVVGTLSWFAWPAWPLACWTLHQARRTGILRPAVPLGLLSFVLLLAMTSLYGGARDVDMLPLLLPLVLLAAGAVTTLPRSSVAALDWFGIMTFGLLSVYIWLAYSALMLGQPARLAAHLGRLSPSYVAEFNPIALLAAVALTAAWLMAVTLAHRNHRAITNWALGVTLIWGLVSTLGLPYLDAAKSYRNIFGQLQAHLPASYGCLESMRLSDEERSLLEYHTRLQARPVQYPSGRCNWLITRIERGQPALLLPGWQFIWTGGRRGERSEQIALLRRMD